MIKLFITATDTDAGKTYVAQLLTAALVKMNFNVAVFKPISAGCERIASATGEVLVNEDAQLLLHQANCGQTINEINPLAFEPAIAPHIAANLMNTEIKLSDINLGYNNVLARASDIVITEGAGGWRLPLGHGKFLSEFVQQTNQQVILVVNMKLGCLNHAVLTYETIRTDGLDCIGWIANCIEPMSYLHENIAELTTLISAPMIAQLGFEADLNKAVSAINLSSIIELL
ncbi:MULTISPECIES: dethiobiotin synthase [unclassified Colwellia]|uniref:dethiobiotin synthase n=1 Tax=unclassified Colwellia TaxID=196834 RepID=UPI0015F38400|nr:MULTISPECIES: dethiobiotin synthase [unclassified Colwellia]MBA6232904.1 dethiobiotin synthase [Colwellia sp. MB02u-7]MBA6237038.1 dethiobiotin synthase [Colwellia sp. MB02u-11]MBA6258176.1 dethiobiotin synthase [Colwellia sp. MB3u-28]MBA6259603.1 dethiobiotin synthase [Colwellia sp. MB3u-41]MBA6299483.1 dethiobiotin synthase [Colwellia sp. MB3u-22]